MIIDRKELLDAIKFLKPAIMKGSRDILTFLHVRIDEGKCIMTGSNGHCGKRVTLMKPPQMEFEDEPEAKALDDFLDKNEFLIPLAMLKSYQAMLQEHHSIFKDSPDKTLCRVEIGPTALESHIEKIEYSQPVSVKNDDARESTLVYPNRDSDFYGGGSPVQNMTFNTGNIIDALKEFGCQAEFTFSGESGAVYVKNHDASYEAFFKPV